MLADVFDFSGFGLAPSDAAMSEVATLGACSLCHAPPLERAASHATTLAWLDAHAPGEAVRMREATVRENDQPGGYGGWKSIRTRAATDSELWPGYAIPVELLESVVAQLDATLEDFAPDAFLAMICGRCAAEPMSLASIGERLERVYVEVRVQGNERVAQLQPAWALVQRFTAIVDGAARGGLQFG